MSEPRRPEPVMRWTDRLRERHSRWRDELRLRRQTIYAPPAPHPDAIEEGTAERRSNVVGGLVVVGSALLALGLVWGWQVWANRSAEPIDGLLPMLAAGTEDETPGVIENTVTPPTVAESPSDTPADQATAAAVDQGDAGPVGAVSETAEPTTPLQAIVHVSGAVVSPGVVVLMPEARVFEAVQLAGGATAAADLDRVNLAAPIVDGERIHVPTHGEDVAPPLVPSVRPSSTAGTDVAAADPVIDINTASATDLESLPGVGPAIAQAIVQTRVDRGPFLSLDELLDVPGIGDTKLEQMRPFAVVGP